MDRFGGISESTAKITGLFQNMARTIFKTCKIFFCNNDRDESSVVNPETLIFSNQIFRFKTFVCRKHFLELIIDRPRLSLLFLSSCIKVLELYCIYFYIFNSAWDFFKILGQTQLRFKYKEVSVLNLLGSDRPMPLNILLQMDNHRINHWVWKPLGFSTKLIWSRALDLREHY